MHLNCLCDSQTINFFSVLGNSTVDSDCDAQASAAGGRVVSGGGEMSGQHSVPAAAADLDVPHPHCILCLLAFYTGLYQYCR